MTSTPDVAARRFDELDKLLDQASTLAERFDTHAILDDTVDQAVDQAYADLVKEAGELADTVTLWAAGLVRRGSELAAVTHRLQREPSLATASQAKDLAGIIGLLGSLYNALRNDVSA